MERKIYCEKAAILTEVPIQTVYGMEICQEQNEHGCIRIQAVIAESEQEEAMAGDFSGKEIKVLLEEKPLFHGYIETITFHSQGRHMEVELEGYGGSKELDRRFNRRSFQEPAMTYRDVIDKSLAAYPHGDFRWSTGEDRGIVKPIIQYDETDWEFFKRIASRFSTVLYADIETGRPAFWVGMKRGEEHKAEEMELLKFGISDAYYALGGPGAGLSKQAACYMEVRAAGNWEIGDFVYYEGSPYTVCRRRISFQKGELIFCYELGGELLYRTQKQHHDKLWGLKLEGTVKRTEKEEVYLQLDIDREDNAVYPWPWMPETGNLCYFMPEIGTKATLYLPSGDEQEGMVIHAVRSNQGSGIFTDVQNREAVSVRGKRINMHPGEILMQGQGGKLSLSDHAGIRLQSQAAIHVQAQGGITVNGQMVSMNAPKDIVHKTASSNIELSGIINLYAPGGVETKGSGASAAVKKLPAAAGQEEKKTEQWRAAFTAMAAVPAVDLAKGDPDGIADIKAAGAIPKIGKGSAIVAMSETMSGKKENETSFPTAFRSMESYTIKGGYPIPPVS